LAETALFPILMPGVKHRQNRRSAGHLIELKCNRHAAFKTDRAHIWPPTPQANRADMRKERQAIDPIDDPLDIGARDFGAIGFSRTNSRMLSRCACALRP
jgi:hypothetical protein